MRTQVDLLAARHLGCALLGPVVPTYVRSKFSSLGTEFAWPVLIWVSGVKWRAKERDLPHKNRAFYSLHPSLVV